MLKDTFKLAEDIVSKNPIIFEVCLEKILEFFLCHRILEHGTMFLLVLLLDHRPVKKRGGKKNLIWVIGPSSFDKVFTLLAETIAV